ncbi:hypothetical protein GOODEAATRI_012813 [Goodea atripinnis]|uniref:Uncharacterized protein n=1 Tax=Goodea atripinnis TaxID=208336 RepID=A0ABV0N0W3_9TELE
MFSRMFYHLISPSIVLFGPNRSYLLHHLRFPVEVNLLTVKKQPSLNDLNGPLLYLLVLSVTTSSQCHAEMLSMMDVSFASMLLSPTSSLRSRRWSRTALALLAASLASFSLAQSVVATPPADHSIKHCSCHHIVIEDDTLHRTSVSVDGGTFDPSCAGRR